MEKDILGVINLGEKEEFIRELTEERPLATVPFGGRYRIIDFILSNMINSRIDDIAVVLKEKFHSLNDHIGPGKYWDLDRKTGGLRLLYPSLDYTDFTITLGDLAIFQENMDYFIANKKSHILLTRSNYLGNIDFTEAIKDHIESGRDITFLIREVQKGRDKVEFLGMDMVTADENGKLTVGTNLGSHDDIELSAEMYLIKKEVFLDIIQKAIEEGKEAYFRTALINRVREYEAGVFPLKDELVFINSTHNYFNASMRLLGGEYSRYLFFKNGKIITKAMDAPPTIYRSNSSAKNSLVANGCIIEGTVENSIIFRNVVVEKGTVIRNSIIFQDTVIGKNCTINYCIFDKNVEIGNSKILMGDGGLPYVVKKGVRIR